MKFKTVQSLLATAMALNLSLAIAAPPVIGTVVAKGSFLLDNSAVTGNATLFEGASIETGTTSSSMELSGGAKVFMAPASKGRFFDDHMILERGEARLDRAPGFHFEALGLTIQPDMGNSSAQVTILSRKRVEVRALAGSFHVLNSRGLLVANLGPGRALQLEPQSANGLSRLSGCLLKKHGHFVLTDETTKVIVELTGPGLDQEAGNRIEIAGHLDPAQPTSDASQVIRVTSVTRRGHGCVGDAAAPAGTGGSPGSVGSGRGSAGSGGAAGGVAAGHAVSMATIAIIGGVAAAAAVGGLVAAEASGQSGSSPSISR